MESILNSAELEMEAAKRERLIAQGLMKEELAIRDGQLPGPAGASLAIKNTASHGDALAPPPAPPPSNMMPDNEQELYAGPEIGTLGLTYSSTPPKRLIVKGVAPLSWGAYMGVQPGDEIEKVNREPAVWMSSEEFKKTVKERPIIFSIRRPDNAALQVGRVQLQRMLEDDAILQEVCGAERAVDVVRRFRVEQSGIDPYEAVA